MMKKLSFLAAAAALMLVSCNSGGTYSVTVNFADESTEGQTLYLTSYDTGDTLNQAVVKDKSATLQGPVEATYMARMLLEGKRVGFVVESGQITIDWQQGKATGTLLNEKLNAINDEIGQIEKSMEGNKDEALAAEADAKVRDCFLKAYEENRNNGIGPWAFNYYLMYNEFSVQQLDSIIGKAPENYRQLKRVEKALNAARQLEATAVGKPFTDFTDASGVRLSDFAGKGKYTLVDFWASWCGPCRREMPNIKQLYDKYKDKMNFVGVAVWDKPEDTQKAIEQLQLPWPVMQGGQNWTAPTDLYGVSGIPHILLIDPEGKIVARQLHGELLLSTINDLKL